MIQTTDYFYRQQANQFAFYRIPKMLFSDERFRDRSLEAKLLYGILLDRMELSTKNGWLDEKGRVYIIFTDEEVTACLAVPTRRPVPFWRSLKRRLA